MGDVANNDNLKSMQPLDVPSFEKVPSDFDEVLDKSLDGDTEFVLLHSGHSGTQTMLIFCLIRIIVDCHAHSLLLKKSYATKIRYYSDK